MITATRIVLLVFLAMFFLYAMGAKEEKRCYIALTGSAIAGTLLLLAFCLIQGRWAP